MPTEKPTAHYAYSSYRNEFCEYVVSQYHNQDNIDQGATQLHQRGCADSRWTNITLRDLDDTKLKAVNRELRNLDRCITETRRSIKNSHKALKEYHAMHESAEALSLVLASNGVIQAVKEEVVA
jgi:hypothetical protein